MGNSITVRKINDLTEVVKACLSQSPDTRDNDKLLFLKVWGYQNPSIRDSDFSFKMFATGFLEKQYAEPASISRTRQLLQAEHKELRGDKWYLRHNEAEYTRREVRDA
jgi:hypothetical protein